MFRVVLLSSRAKFVCRVPNQTKSFGRLPKVSLRVNGYAKSRLGNPTDKLPPVTVDAMLNDTTFQRHTTQRTAATTALVLANSPFRFHGAPARGVDDVSSHQTTESSRCLAFSPTFKRSAKRRMGCQSKNQDAIENGDQSEICTFSLVITLHVILSRCPLCALCVSSICQRTFPGANFPVPVFSSVALVVWFFFSALV